MTSELATYTPRTVSTQLINEFEAGIVEKVRSGELKEVELPLTHHFIPGMYIRDIFMPANSIVVSRTHKTDHPYFILEGDVSVYDEAGKIVDRFKAGHVAITPAGTRRVLFMHEDTRWRTCHITELTDPDEIVNTITEHENPFLPSDWVDAAFRNTK